MELVTYKIAYAINQSLNMKEFGCVASASLKGAAKAAHPIRCTN